MKQNANTKKLKIIFFWKQFVLSLFVLQVFPVAAVLGLIDKKIEPSSITIAPLIAMEILIVFLSLYAFVVVKRDEVQAEPKPKYKSKYEDFNKSLLELHNIITGRNDTIEDIIKRQQEEFEKISHLKYCEKCGVKLNMMDGVCDRCWAENAKARIDEDIKMAESLVESMTKNKNTPSLISDKLHTIFPTDESDIKLGDWQQTVEVYDPRLSMPVGQGNTVQILRILKRVPEDDSQIKTKFFMIPIKTIEVIKEYSFEEWDAGNEK